MRPLVPPRVSGDAIYLSIANSKIEPNKSILSGIEQSILARFRIYENEIYSLEKIPKCTYPPPEKAALLLCYNSETIARTKAINTILSFNETLTICNYCGFAPADTIDHYLPKEDFPEFSVFAINLIPCCNKCNLIKDRTVSVNGHRQIINFYFDNIIHQKCLVSEIIISRSVKFVFKVRIDPSVNISEMMLYHRHFAALKLGSRLSKHASAEIPYSLSIVRNLNNKDPRIIRRLFLREAEISRGAYGNNYWRAALYEAAAASSDYIDYCIANS